MVPRADRTYTNILIVKLSAIGDVVHALPVAYALKQCFPAARITWVVEKPAYDLLANNPCIDEIIVFDKPKLKKVSGIFTYAPGFVRLLRSRRFDLALDLQALFKSGAIAYMSGAPERYVYCNTRELSDKLSRRICGPHQDGHVVERYLDVVRALGCEVKQVVFPIHITDGERQAAAKAAKEAGLDLDSPYVLLSPGANWPNKRWPTACFAALADKLRQGGLVSVVSGGPGDAALAAEIAAAAATPPVDLTGKTSLKQLTHIIKHARAFVGGDTGPMHLAAALATPVVALHGPTDTIRNGPYGSGHKALVTAHSCAGCWRRACPKGLDCLAGITVEAVHDALNTILG
ncbi:glycosyltransferase family 9 protein [Anaeroselena agilis]|uniref:Glycosyltransferase family 9 protein n=1 Tax=Anaeroselena agilis TaxID=3063788 RepID=A0ABU3P440_9FIRM|nr:glycosyltransferase family 9 protein [Selenomonadales bacterium 4137-cl]